MSYVASLLELRQQFRIRAPTGAFSVSLVRKVADVKCKPAWDSPPVCARAIARIGLGLTAVGSHGEDTARTLRMEVRDA
jgi:hypothetical protein